LLRFNPTKPNKTAAYAILDSITIGSKIRHKHDAVNLEIPDKKQHIKE
jgi:hypothetical protein